MILMLQRSLTTCTLRRSPFRWDLPYFNCLSHVQDIIRKLWRQCCMRVDFGFARHPPTLTIVIRLVLHARIVRAATGSPAGLSGLYKTTAARFIKSSVIYINIPVLPIGLWATGYSVSYALPHVVCIIQICAPAAAILGQVA